MGKQKKMPASVVSLPDEIVFEILSLLPVKSLLRFKCVCKIWCSTIEDPSFIQKHMEQAAPVLVYDEDHDAEVGSEFIALSSFHGIILERHNSNNTYRLRNGATKQIVDLPSLQTETKGIPTRPCYIRSTNKLKVVYLHFSKQGEDKEVVTYNVLRVDKYFTWKRFVSPLLGDLRQSEPRFLQSASFIGTVFYHMRLAGDIYIDCIDLENENITNVKVPQNFFSEDIVDWEGKLSLARIEEGQLIIRVLENYKNHKWADSNIIIPLTFLRDRLPPIMLLEEFIPCFVTGNLIHFRFIYSNWLFLFDTRSKEVKYLTPLSASLYYTYEPSLLPLHFKVKRRTQESSFSKVYAPNS